MKRTLMVIGFAAVMTLALILVISGCSISGEQSAPVTTPAPTQDPATYGIDEIDEYINSFDYEPQDKSILFYIGEEPVYAYMLACSYRAVVDDFVKSQPDYSEDMTLQETIKLRDKLLETNDAQLREKAVEELKLMAAMHFKAWNLDAGMSYTAYRRHFGTWKRYGVEYYNRLKDVYPDIDSPDDAMRFMTGANVMETTKYMQTNANATAYTSTWYREDESTDAEYEAYYAANRDRFRQVTIRAVYFEDEGAADNAKKLMDARPQDIDNLAKALNMDERLARAGGLVTVTSECDILPEEVINWAVTRTGDDLFEKHGRIEKLRVGEGWYLLTCESITDFANETGNDVYYRTAEAYKREKLNKYLYELMDTYWYGFHDFDAELAVKTMDEAIEH